MKKILKGAVLALGGLAVVKGLDSRLEITYEQILSSRVPDEFDNFKIAHLSDYHNDYIPGLAEAIKEEKPDIIVCTGDMADDKGSYLPALSLMKNLVRTAPVYTVTGNHDLWRGDYDKMESEMKDLGVKFLRNERDFITKNESKISLAGIDDPFVCEQKRIKQYVRESAEMLGEYEGFDILLFHRANLIDEFSDYSFDLILSGHMHGGHVRIPFVGGVASPKSSLSGGDSLLFPKYFGGCYNIGSTCAIVSRGLGNPTPVPRFFNRPELIIVTLNKKK